MKLVGIFLSMVLLAAPLFGMYDPMAIPPGFDITAASYNVENLFDTQDDPGKNDAEYLPNGKAKWTDIKLKLKVTQLAKVIRAMNNGRGPDILTLPETENQRALDLLNEALPGMGYQAILVEGPDERGIDIGLLTRFPLTRKPQTARVDDMSDPMWKRPTRLVTMVTVRISRLTNLSILLNHWPSRAQGDDYRCAAASVARKLAMKKPGGRFHNPLLIMGDLNDEPENISLQKCLGIASAAQVIASSKNNPLFYNPYYDFPVKSREERGTYYYLKDKAWNALDHIVMSKELLVGSGLAYIPGSFKRVQTKDNAYSKPTKSRWGDYFPVGAPIAFQAFVGREGYWIGWGASDHLPVIARFKVIH